MRRGILGWFLERSGASRLSAGTAALLRKPVPARPSWLYTVGSLAIFYFGLQVVTGCLLLTHYVPDEKLAYSSLQTIEHRASLGWLVRQMHSWGASFVVLVLIFHVLKVLWHGSYKRPREFTWFAGCLLFGLTLAFCFSGYLLPWNQLSFWATTVSLEAVDAVPGVGSDLKTLVCGGKDVSGATLGRFFALHVVVLPALLVPLLAYHLYLVTVKGSSPKCSVDEEARLGAGEALYRQGAEPFFPRQVYRDLLICNLGFALLVTFATFWPWEIGEPANRFETPAGIKPEWYFLPMYQLLKYCDENLYAALPFLSSWNWSPAFVGVLIMSLAAAVFFFLPVLDRGRERRLRRRPFFAVLAHVAILAVVLLGVLGYLSGRTVSLLGWKIHFDNKGVPSLVGDAERPGTKPPAAPGSGKSADRAETTLVAAPAPVRVDGLAPGGTCGACHEKELKEWTGSVHFEASVECRGCHGGIDGPVPEKLLAPLEALVSAEDSEFEWPEEVPSEDERRKFLHAHQGILLRRGKWEAPGNAEVPSFCGASCHPGVLAEFRRAWAQHMAEAPGLEPHGAKACSRCHSNHEVRRPHPLLDPSGGWGSLGYTDEKDPRRAPFRAIASLLAGLDAKLRAGEQDLESLRKLVYPVDELAKGLESAAQAAKELRPLVHTLDVEKVESGVKEVETELRGIQETLAAAASARDDRWIFAAGVWAVALFLSGLCVLKLLSLRRAERGAGGDLGTAPEPAAEPPRRLEDVLADRAAVPGGAAADARLSDERSALLAPLEEGPSPQDDGGGSR